MQFNSVFWVTGLVELKSKRPINQCLGTEASLVDLKSLSLFQGYCGK